MERDIPIRCRLSIEAYLHASITYGQMGTPSATSLPLDRFHSFRADIAPVRLELIDQLTLLHPVLQCQLRQPLYQHTLMARASRSAALAPAAMMSSRNSPRRNVVQEPGDFGPVDGFAFLVFLGVVTGVEGDEGVGVGEVEADRLIWQSVLIQT